MRNITTHKVNKHYLDKLTPYTTYKISVAAGNKHGFGVETITSFKTSEEGIRMRLCQYFKYGRFF